MHNERMIIISILTKHFSSRFLFYTTRNFLVILYIFNSYFEFVAMVMLILQMIIIMIMLKIMTMIMIMILMIMIRVL